MDKTITIEGLLPKSIEKLRGEKDVWGIS